MKAAILVDQQECERKLRVASHQSVCGCNLQLEMLRDKVGHVNNGDQHIDIASTPLGERGCGVAL